MTIGTPENIMPTTFPPFTARSMLFVPGDRPERFSKAVASGADAPVIDSVVGLVVGLVVGASGASNGSRPSFRTMPGLRSPAVSSFPPLAGAAAAARAAELSPPPKICARRTYP